MKELDHIRKGLINVQSIDDNECFKWCFIRYLNPVDYNPRRFAKAGKDFAKRLDFKDIKFPVKIIDIHRIKRKNFINISIYENKGKCPIYVSKECCEEKHVLIKYFNRLMYDHSLHRGRNIFVVIVYSFTLQKKN